MAINVVFPASPTAPSSTDKTNFRTRYDAFLAYIQNLGTLLISFVTQLNSTETNINAKEASAVAAQVAAASSANFQGTWTNQTTVVGQSWLYGGVTYRVLIAGNTSPIASPNNWNPIASTMGSISETFTTVAGTWYRIAQSAVNINKCDGLFSISLGGPNHQVVRFSASVVYGSNPCLSQVAFSKLGANGITQARIVYHPTYTGNYAYLEVLYSTSATNQVFNIDVMDVSGWSLLPPSTVGSIPAGHSNLTYAFQSTTVAGTYKSVTVDSDGSVTAGTNPTTLAGFGITDAALDSETFGINQTWQDVSGSRALGTTYANSTGKPILVNVTCSSAVSTAMNHYLNGIIIQTTSINSTTNGYAILIVPNGSTYRIEGGILAKWSELR